MPSNGDPQGSSETTIVLAQPLQLPGMTEPTEQITFADTRSYHVDERGTLHITHPSGNIGALADGAWVAVIRGNATVVEPKGPGQ